MLLYPSFWSKDGALWSLVCASIFCCCYRRLVALQSLSTNAEKERNGGINPQVNEAVVLRPNMHNHNQGPPRRLRRLRYAIYADRTRNVSSPPYGYGRTMVQVT
ncbi:hypothetical protein BDP55DRAFT_684927 [Colletotrichum godetiae]|uniref:Uncharacterized protein n=1 Tax=Colletotrichum godetiae TaxID=1209918 RepID=A0AAJ0A703_9PEZI|nr:uncharacterized protein BDP55DRAFT_684927 [Colletotrichum godetiae]KAK1657658.1 hypothetical protein BDP55DRAFT_684927 [Colletotrichum godetiae]